jgi:hypothetical protein
MLSALEEEFGSIDLAVGDIIIDPLSGEVGVLLERVHRIDMALDDMYFWKIKWNVTESKMKETNLSRLLEEDYLKMSIFLGIIKWQSTKGGTFEL